MESKGHQQEYMSPSMAAKKWGVSRRTITSWIHDGYVTDAQKVGGMGWIIPVDASKPNLHVGGCRCELCREWKK